ncbi:hypothetical protein [Kitasatospora sp. NPDC089509]|uniref:hypothetical protein n=1 Tax=Kitasatospora sp. NPDC089509 TaxID=3364079 RepID=UPI0037F8A396
MSPTIQMSQSTNAGGGRGGLMNTLKRAVGGGGLFLTRPPTAAVDPAARCLGGRHH